MQNELIIAFTRNTGKKLARVFCRNFRHCVVLFPADGIVGAPPTHRNLTISSGSGNCAPHPSPVGDTRPPRGAGKGRKYAPLHILVQIGIDGVRLFAIDAAAQRRMKKAGWEFVNVGANENSPISWAQHVAPLQFLTCVGFAKRAMGMHAPFVWTPDQLYKKLSRCDNFL